MAPHLITRVIIITIIIIIIIVVIILIFTIIISILNLIRSHVSPKRERPLGLCSDMVC